MRKFATVLAVAVALPLAAAAPASQSQPPGTIDHEAELTVDTPVEFEGQEATGAVNPFTHFSLWDGNTCHSDAGPDTAFNRCDRILVHVPLGGEATFTMTPAYEIADYDMIVYESGKSGEAFSIVAHEQNEVFVAGEGPIPVPGPETVTFEARADGWYLVAIFYRAAGGGHLLEGSLA